MGSFLSAVIDPAPVTPRLVWLVVAVIGLLVWGFGSRAARAVCAVIGLIWGGLVVFAIAQAAGVQDTLLHWVIGGAIGGLLLAVLFFRVWMGLILAAVLALSLPAAGLAWGRVPLPVVDVPEAAPGFVDLEFGEPAADTFTEDEIHAKADEVRGRLSDAALSWVSRVRAGWDRWWPGLDRGVQGAVIVAAGGGAAVGMVLGLMVPSIAAAVSSAWFGGVLMLFGAWQFAAPQGVVAGVALPQEAATKIGLLGLITLLGVLMQWTVLGRRADS